MTQKIVITQGIHSYDQSAYYEIFCTRCHSGVEGRDRQRNRVWATKASALKHAQAHADWHAELDQANWVGYSFNRRTVEEIQL